MICDLPEDLLLVRTENAASSSYARQTRKRPARVKRYTRKFANPAEERRDRRYVSPKSGRCWVRRSVVGCLRWGSRGEGAFARIPCRSHPFPPPHPGNQPPQANADTSQATLWGVPIRPVAHPEVGCSGHYKERYLLHITHALQRAQCPFVDLYIELVDLGSRPREDPFPGEVHQLVELTAISPIRVPETDRTVSL
jgi:hypothetical protein